MPLLRVYLVDDNLEFLKVAKRFLAINPDIKVIGQALSPDVALKEISDLHPDLVLMDPWMCSGNGLKCMYKIKQLPNPPQLVILTLFDYHEYYSMVEMGLVDGMLTKSEFGTQLFNLIDSLLEKVTGG
jgi:DNA-binding NarL/FixJ family response regulator